MLRNRRSLTGATEPMQAPCGGLVLTSKVRPVQAEGLLLLRLTQRVE